MRVTKELVNGIKDYILDCDNIKECLSELRRYRKDFFGVPDYNYYRYGNILPYYSDMRDFILSLGLECTEDNEEMCKVFCKACGKAIDEILAK